VIIGDILPNPVHHPSFVGDHP